jgi:hypothetical protein
VTPWNVSLGTDKWMDGLRKENSLCDSFQLNLAKVREYERNSFPFPNINVCLQNTTDQGWLRRVFLVRVERTEGVVGGGGVGLVTPCRTIGSGLDGVALLPAELEATSRMGTRAPVRPLE